MTCFDDATCKWAAILLGITTILRPPRRPRCITSRAQLGADKTDRTPSLRRWRTAEAPMVKAVGRSVHQREYVQTFLDLRAQLAAKVGTLEQFVGSVALRVPVYLHVVRIPRSNHRALVHDPCILQNCSHLPGCYDCNRFATIKLRLVPVQFREPKQFSPDLLWSLVNVLATKQ